MCECVCVRERERKREKERERERERERENEERGTAADPVETFAVLMSFLKTFFGSHYDLKDISTFCKRSI